MMLLISMLEATNTQGNPWSFWIMIVLIFVIMYFFMIRPQKKKQKQIENFRKSLGVGNQVVTAGGIHGVIREVNNANNTVVLEIDKNVKITIEKSSIYANAGSVAEAQQSK
ncbi:MAG: preprotein translocase subunit YajC [Prevotellaceae bacterium]|nr:preprotein translocase subunit YajC [Prevotellaceae bacterium]